jgi:hypothetical protein
VGEGNCAVEPLCTTIVDVGFLLTLYRESYSGLALDCYATIDLVLPLPVLLYFSWIQDKLHLLTNAYTPAGALEWLVYEWL